MNKFTIDKSKETKCCMCLFLKEWHHDIIIQGITYTRQKKKLLAFSFANGFID